jgi:hypothetical protein
MMPAVRNIQAASVQGRTQRAQAASTLPFDQRSDGKGKGNREANIADVEKRRMDGECQYPEGWG